MRLLHTSDLHLGLQLHGAPLIGYQKIMLDSLCNIAVSEKADALIISGDVFDRAVPPSEAVEVWSAFVGRLCGELGIPAFVIAGNHDGGVRLASCSEILKGGGLYIAGTLTSGIETVTLGDTAVHLLPYYTPEDVRAAYPEREINGWQDANDAMCEAALSHIVPGMFNILLVHCFVSGASKSDSERSVIQGGLNSIEPSCFDGFDYVAAGHLHRRQTLGKVHYSGTPLCYSFAECGHKKSVTLIDTESGSVTDITTKQPYILRELVGSFDEITAVGHCEDFVRAEVTSGYGGYASLETLRALFPNLLCVSVARQNDTSCEYSGSYTGEDMSPNRLLLAYCGDTGLEFDDELAKWFCDTAERIMNSNSERASGDTGKEDDGK